MHACWERSFHPGEEQEWREFVTSIMLMLEASTTSFDLWIPTNSNFLSTLDMPTDIDVQNVRVNGLISSDKIESDH